MKNSKQQTANIELNYQELGFIMEITSSDAQEIFMQHLNIEKVPRKEHLKVKDLQEYFGAVKSCDKRYDGQNELVFNLEHKSNNYKKYLNQKSFIKKRKFTGGANVFNKILSEDQLIHAKQVFEFKFKFLGYKDESEEIQ